MMYFILNYEMTPHLDAPTWLILLKVKDPADILDTTGFFYYLPSY